MSKMKTTIAVKGMHCKSCEMLLQESINDIVGVKSVKADWKKGKVEVEMESANIMEELKDAIRKEGYEA